MPAELRHQDDLDGDVIEEVAVLMWENTGRDERKLLVRVDAIAATLQALGKLGWRVTVIDGVMLITHKSQLLSLKEGSP